MIATGWVLAFNETFREWLLAVADWACQLPLPALRCFGLATAAACLALCLSTARSWRSFSSSLARASIYGATAPLSKRLFFRAVRDNSLSGATALAIIACAAAIEQLGAPLPASKAWFGAGMLVLASSLPAWAALIEIHDWRADVASSNPSFRLEKTSIEKAQSTMADRNAIESHCAPAKASNPSKRL